MGNIGQTWREVQRRLEAAGAEPAPREGQWIVRHVLGLDGLRLALEEQAPFPAAKRGELDALVAKRRSGVPLAYVLGVAEFAGRDWKVTPDVLIPRPDTETLLEAALKEIPAGWRARVAEVGVGSGAVIGSLLLERPEVTAAGTDISPPALAVAEENWRRAGVAARIEAHCADLLAGVEGGFDVILSNPPYISEAEHAALDASVRDQEPRLALLAGDGLDVYRRLIPQAAEKLVKGGALLLEIGWKQAAAVRTLLEADGWQAIRALQDLAGRDRVVSARLGR